MELHNRSVVGGGRGGRLSGWSADWSAGRMGLGKRQAPADSLVAIAATEARIVGLSSVSVPIDVDSIDFILISLSPFSYNS